MHRVVSNYIFPFNENFFSVLKTLQFVFVRLLQKHQYIQFLLVFLNIFVGMWAEFTSVRCFGYNDFRFCLEPAPPDHGTLADFCDLLTPGSDIPSSLLCRCLRSPLGVTLSSSWSSGNYLSLWTLQFLELKISKGHLDVPQKCFTRHNLLRF